MSQALDNPIPQKAQRFMNIAAGFGRTMLARVSSAFRDALLGIGLLRAVILRSGFAVDYGSACGVTAT
jgi:hypothetical protein